MRLSICLLLIALLPAAAMPEPPSQHPSRAFTFDYHAVFTPPANAKVRIWIPVPSTTPDQTVKILSAPPAVRYTTERTYGNRLAYLEPANPAGAPIQLDFTYSITRYEDHGQSALPDSEHDMALFLKPSSLVPVGGKSLALLKGMQLPQSQFDLARTLYNVVFDHMEYRKDKPGWGTGNSDWAVESCYGNCTDFHSLFISLARSQHIPAKFEIGFMIGDKSTSAVAGYHCWAKFQPAGKGWIPVDIADARQHPEKRAANFGTLEPNRVMFSTGRDLTLDPPQAAGPVNFIVYPYVEIDGKPLAQDAIEKHFYKKEIPPIATPHP